MFTHLIDPVISIAEAAGKIALRYFPNYRTGKDLAIDSNQIQWKADNSPVTQADKEMDRLIREQLTGLIDNTLIISEESPSQTWSERCHWQQTWIVDPLDGTKHYIAGKIDYTVNIALVKHGVTELSVILAPSRNLCYYAIRNEGAFKRSPTQDIQLRSQTHQKNSNVRIAISHGVPGWKLNSHIERYEQYQFVTLGSSLKPCWIAEGLADVYPRFGKTNEWDTAASQLILEESGGKFIDNKGKALVYNKQNLANPEFIAHAPWYKPSTPWY